MEKPIVNTFSAIAPLIIQKYERYLPTAFDESLSILQKMNMIINYLDTVGALSNDVVTQWNSVMSWVMSDGLTSDVNAKLDSMKADGTLDTIINHNIFDQLNTDITTANTNISNDIKNSFSGKNIVSLLAYPRLTGETDDTARINRAYTDTPVKGILNLSSDVPLLISSTINITKSVFVIGNQTELKTITQGMDNTFDVNGVDTFGFCGLRFNQNLMGRTSITIRNGCTNFIVEKCFFTGYSKQYAYYQTDGGIRLDNATSGLIMNNTWQDHGYQYTNDTADLNRCLQINGTTSDNITVTNNIFNKVNQAIIVNCGNHIITNNVFTEVQDNVLYILDYVKSVLFEGNNVDHRHDECIVISSGKITINGNIIKNVPNKAIAITTIGTYLPEIIITNNHFDNSDITTGQFIAWRDMSYSIGFMLVKDNHFKCPVNTNPYPYFDFGNHNRIKFIDNIVNVATQAFQRIVYFEGTTATGEIKNNRFIGTDSTAKSIEVLNTIASPDVIYEDNSQQNCRGVFYGLVVRNHSVQFNVGPYILNRIKNTIISSSAMPTQGNFVVGDYCKNENKSVLGSVGSKYVLNGWTRLTSGSVHVLNTDWTEDRALTGQ